MGNDETAAMLVSVAEKWGAPIMVTTPNGKFGKESDLRISLGNNKEGDEIIIVHPLPTQGLAHALHVVPKDQKNKLHFIESLALGLAATRQYDELSRSSSNGVAFLKISSLAYHFLQILGVGYKTICEAKWVPHEEGLLAEISSQFAQGKIGLIRCGPEIKVQPFELKKPAVSYAQTQEDEQELLLKGVGPYPETTLAAAIGKPIGKLVEGLSFDQTEIIRIENDQEGLLIISKINTRILN